MYFLYNENRTILCTIVLAFAAEVSAMVIVLCLSMPKIEFGGGGEEAESCLVGGTPDFFVTYWCVIFLCTLYLPLR